MHDKTRNCDVLVIGGGINGCGIAADAASRGLDVILCEKNDLGEATSSASSKLIHGGLRYLEYYNFGLVRKALKEREILFKICPHLIKPLGFVLPHQQHLRPAWLIRLGLFIYDHLCTTKVKKAQYIKRKNHSNNFTNLNQTIESGFKYYDAMTIDSRLVVLNALQAKKYGAEILPGSKFMSTKRHADHWLSTINISRDQEIIKSKLLVNAAGPWAGNINQQVNLFETKQLSLVQGSHIVVPQLYQGEHAYILQNEDNRIVFTIPYMNTFTLIGTTDLSLYKMPDQVEMTNTELNYLITVIKNYFNKTIAKEDIVHQYCGIRPLLESAPDAKASKITRDYKVCHDFEAAPYSCVFGGKLTTYRRLAEDCVDAWQTYFPNLPSSNTAQTPLPGGNFDSEQQLKNDLNTKYPFLNEPLLAHFCFLYGTLTHQILEGCNNMNDLGDHFGGLLYEKEVIYLLENEWAKTSDDILWRRTKHGLFLNLNQKKRLEKFIPVLP